MAETTALETALQSTVERMVERRLEGLCRELPRSLQGEFSSALARSAGSSSSAAAMPGGSPAQLAALSESVAGILEPTAQSEVMAACLQAAVKFAGRCALFVRRGDAYGFWRAEGFASDAGGLLRSVNASAVERGIFKSVTEQQQPISTELREDLPSALQHVAGDAIAKGIHLFPVVVQGKVIAALYADGASAQQPVRPPALDVIARVTGLSLETSAARAASQAARRPAPDAVPEPLSTTPEGKMVEEGPPPTAAEPTEARQPAPQFEEQSGSLPGSFAASIPSASGTASDLAPPPDPESLPEEERDVHRKAHRFARVAVQDLLSYHKSKIEQGREKKNLYSMLKEDIEKTRENYQKRFGETPARAFDYLHYELVLKLSGNDPTTLGAQYPGPFEAR